MTFKLNGNRGELLVLAAIFFSLAVPGCVKTISHRQLLEIPRGTEVNTLPTIIWYMGSKNGFDYFNVGIGKGDSSLSPLNEEYKVESENTGVTNRFKLTNDKSKWKVYRSPLKPGQVLEPGPIFRQPGPLITEPEPEPLIRPAKFGALPTPE